MMRILMVDDMMSTMTNIGVSGVHGFVFKIPIRSDNYGAVKWLS